MMQQSNARQCEKIIVQVDSDLEDIIPIFLENRHKDIKCMLECLKQSDYESIRILGHSMKGAGGGYGFDTITDIGSSLEQAAKDKNFEKIRKLVDELTTYLARAEGVYE